MDDSKVMAMPTIKDLLENNVTTQQWLFYYRNVWTRNLIARTIDVQSDMTRKALNPEEMVTMDDGSGRPVPVKERLEARKLLIEDALEIIRSTNELLLLGDQKIYDNFWSKEALQVAPDMLEKPEEKTGEATPVPTPEVPTESKVEVPPTPEAGDEAKV